MRRRLRNLDRDPQAATGYPACVMTHRPAARTAVRSVLAGAFVAGVMLAVPASADAPSSWDEPRTSRASSALLVLFLHPAGLFLVISLLAVAAVAGQGRVATSPARPGAATASGSADRARASPAPTRSTPSSSSRR